MDSCVPKVPSDPKADRLTGYYACGAGSALAALLQMRSRSCTLDCELQRHGHYLTAKVEVSK
jgi:hypothetical protein